MSLKADFFNILRTSTASAPVAVRAALGASASSVIGREKIRGGITNLPARPFIALQWVTSGGPRNRGVQTAYPVWWLYDDAVYEHSRIDPLLALVKAAYTENILAMCYVDFLPEREFESDAALSLPATSLPVSIRTRG